MREEALSDCTVNPVKTARVAPPAPLIVILLSMASLVADSTSTCTVIDGSGAP